MIVERIDPNDGQHDTRQIRLHQDRYDFAMRMILWDKHTLDLGCGVGYGTALLSRVSQRVFGVDNNKQAIKAAKYNYARPDIIFIQADAHDIFVGNTIHNLVGLEILEHIDHPVVALERLKELGVVRAVLSTPLNESPGDNPYHKHCWTVDEFKKMVESAGYTYIGRSFEQPDNWTGVFSTT